MSRITLSIPDEAFAALNLTPEKMGERLRLAAAAKLFEMRELSSGAAAALAGLSRTDFLNRLAEFGVPTFQLSREELENEARLD